MLCNTDMETRNETTDFSEEDAEPREEVEIDTDVSLVEKSKPQKPKLVTIPTISAFSFNPFAIPVSVMEDVAAAATPSAVAAAASSPVPCASMHFPKVLWTPPTQIQEFTMDSSVIAEGRKHISSTPPYFKRVAASEFSFIIITVMLT
jgi:hypothetical protein